jgi:hypothetical protein
LALEVLVQQSPQQQEQTAVILFFLLQPQQVAEAVGQQVELLTLLL